MSDWRSRAISADAPVAHDWRSRAIPASGKTGKVLVKTIEAAPAARLDDANTIPSENSDMYGSVSDGKDKTSTMAGLFSAGDAFDVGKRGAALIAALRGHRLSYDPATGESHPLDMSSSTPLSERMQLYDDNLHQIRKFGTQAKQEHEAAAFAGGALPFTVFPEAGLAGNMGMGGLLRAAQSERSPTENPLGFAADTAFGLGEGALGHIGGKVVGKVIKGAANGLDRLNTGVLRSSGLSSVIPESLYGTAADDAAQSAAAHPPPIPGKELLPELGFPGEPSANRVAEMVGDSDIVPEPSIPETQDFAWPPALPKARAAAQPRPEPQMLTPESPAGAAEPQPPSVPAPSPMAARSAATPAEANNLDAEWSPTERGNLSIVGGMLNKLRRFDTNGLGDEAEAFVLKNGPAIRKMMQGLKMEPGNHTPADWVHRDFDIVKSQATKMRRKGLAGVAEEAIVNDPRYQHVRSSADKVKLVETLRDEAGRTIGESAAAFDQMPGPRFDPTIAAQRITDEVLAPLVQHGTALDRPTIQVLKQQIQGLAKRGNHMPFEDAFAKIRALSPHINFDAKTDGPVKVALKQVRGIMKEEAENAADAAAAEANNPALFDKWMKAKRHYGALNDFSEYAAERLHDARKSNHVFSLTDNIWGAGAMGLGPGLAMGSPVAAATGLAGAMTGVAGMAAKKWAGEHGPQMMALSLMRHAQSPGAAELGNGAFQLMSSPLEAAAARAGVPSASFGLQGLHMSPSQMEIQRAQADAIRRARASE